jgi:outer membrane protein OmpA-like peptidoglycan-associated protein
VRPGGSVLLVGGQLVPVVVEPEPGPRPAVITASGSGFIASFGGVGGDGTPLPLGPADTLVVQSVQQGRTGALPTPRAATRSALRRAHAATGTSETEVSPVVATSGDGFLSGSTIRFYVLPDILMGDLVFDTADAFAGDIPVPAGIAPGARTLQMNGYAPDGSVRSLSIGILVKAAGGVAVSKKRASVFFAPMSAKISEEGMAVLRRMIKATGTDAAMTRVVGFVRATGASHNDDSLSTARAAAVKAALRSLGLRGPIDDRGDGAAVQDGLAARRATVTIGYRRRAGGR